MRFHSKRFYLTVINHNGALTTAIRNAALGKWD